MTTAFEFNGFFAIPWPIIVWMLLSGFALGLFFFGSLWFASDKILHSSRAVLWVLGSFLVRLTIVLPTLYWLTNAQWQRLVVCLVGFIVARVLVIRLTAKLPPPWSSNQERDEDKEPEHAS